MQKACRTVDSGAEAWRCRVCGAGAIRGRIRADNSDAHVGCQHYAREWRTHHRQGCRFWLYRGPSLHGVAGVCFARWPDGTSTVCTDGSVEPSKGIGGGAMKLVDTGELITVRFEGRPRDMHLSGKIPPGP